jgi:NAD-dependent SIR2 family protein deacetylase
VTAHEVASKLAGLIRGNQPCVVLTGAGCSQESGIPTFRGPDYIPREVGEKAHVSTETHDTASAVPVSSAYE